MNKILPLIIAAIGSSAAIAAPSPVKSFEYDGVYATAFSDNGRWLVGNTDAEGTIWVQDLANGKYYTYGLGITGNSNYTPGLGKIVSNYGTVIGTIDEMPAYLENGEWTMLSTDGFKGSSGVGSITPDGNVIVGYIGKIGMDLDGNQMSYPVVWYRGEDGKFGNPVWLPNPQKDFLGHSPQHVIAISVSDDGKTIGAMMTVGNGKFDMPYVYIQDENGEWTYKALGLDLTNPDNIEIPREPGGYNGPKYPDWDSYLTDRQRDEMWNAFTEWDKKEQSLGKTDLEMMIDQLYFFGDYMAGDKKDEYLSIVKEYEEKYVPWRKAYNAYEEAIQYLFDNGISYVQNNSFISADGKYVYATALNDVIENPAIPEGGVRHDRAPVRFEVTTDESTLYSWDPAIVVSCVTADGSIMGKVFSPSSDPYIYREAYIFPQGGEEYVKIQDWFKNAGNMEAYDWLEEHLLQEVQTETGYGEFWCLGKPLATPDMSLMAFVSSTLYWTLYENANFNWITALLNTGFEASDWDDGSGVESITDSSDVSLVVLPGGNLEVNGNVNSLKIYTLSGVVAFSAANPSGTIATSLPGGVYVVKAISTDGNTITKKAIF